MSAEEEEREVEPLQRHVFDFKTIDNPVRGLTCVFDFDGVISKFDSDFVDFVRDSDYDFDKNDLWEVDQDTANELVELYFESKKGEMELERQRQIIEEVLPETFAWANGRISIYSGNGATLVKAFMRKVLSHKNDEEFEKFFASLVGVMGKDDSSKAKLKKKGVMLEGGRRKKNVEFSRIRELSGGKKLFSLIGRKDTDIDAIKVGNSVFNIRNNKYDLFVPLIQEHHKNNFMIYVDDNEKQIGGFVRAYREVNSTAKSEEYMHPELWGPVKLIQFYSETTLAHGQVQKVALAHVWHTPPPYWLATTYEVIRMNAFAATRPSELSETDFTPTTPVTRPKKSSFATPITPAPMSDITPPSTAGSSPVLAEDDSDLDDDDTFGEDDSEGGIFD